LFFSPQAASGDGLVILWLYFLGESLHFVAFIAPVK
jgi:hypothetical protein